MRPNKFMTNIKSLLFAILFSVPLTAAAQDVVINAENFPDEKFRNYLLSQKYGADGVLTETEIQGITSINVSSESISSLKGIEHFTALTSLDCYINQLTSLDVSNNKALTYLNCCWNQLTSLDVSNNTALTSLDCYRNQIKGEAMDALIGSLPSNTTDKVYQLRVYYPYAGEGNVCTKSQVAAAKAKGWTPYYTINGWSWDEYEGSDDEIAGTTIEINAENFPDVNFRNYLLSQDYGADGVLTEAEIQGITSIDVSRKSISSLKGIEHFTALTYLVCDGNQLTSLDVSNNTALTTLNCYYNQLTSLDVSNNTALTTLYCNWNQLTSLDVSNNTVLTTLYCDTNQLTSLDVSNNTALEVLWCAGNQLTSLDVSNNAALTTLYCSVNPLTSLDVSNNTALTELECSGNQLTSLDVSNTALTSLRCHNNQLTSLDVSSNTALTRLDCYDNQLTSLDVSNNTALTELYCRNNQLTSLDVSGATALTRLECNENQLTSLDVSGATALTWLNCDRNQLTSLDVSSNTALTGLSCYSNQIKSKAMDVLIGSLPLNTTGNAYSFYVYYTNVNDGNVCTKSQVAAAKAKGWTPYYFTFGWGWDEYIGSDDEIASTNIEINAENFPDEKFRNFLLAQDYGADGVLTEAEIQGITTINVYRLNISSLKGIEHFTALTRLECGWNQLTNLDVSNNTALTWLNCYGNQLTNLDVSSNTALTWLDCYSNQLTSLDISGTTALEILYCDHNQLTNLDVSNNTALTELYCFSNQLTSLDVSNNTALAKLYCYKNQLTSLDVSNNTALKKLECYNNQLTSLDVSNTALTSLECYSNQIKGEAMDVLIGSLPLNMTSYYVYGLYVYYTDENEGNICTKSQVAAAKAKGWTPYYYYDRGWKEYKGSEDPATEPEFEMGDVNGDGDITIADAVATVNYIMGTPNDPFIKEAADMNGDGDITIADVVAIIAKMME